MLQTNAITKRAVTHAKSGLVASLLALSVAAGSAAEAASVEYQVKIKTGTKSGAGTDADVKISLAGTLHPTLKLYNKVLDGHGDDFESGDEDTYIISFDEDLGDLLEAKLEHDNSGSGPGWYVETVKVRKTGTSEWVPFSFNRWLATDEGSGVLEWSLRRSDYATWLKNLGQHMSDVDGRWAHACSQKCEVGITSSFSFGSSEKTAVHKDVRTALAVEMSKTVSASFEGLGASATEKVTGSVQEASSSIREFVSSASNGGTSSCRSSVEPDKYLVEAAYQWVTSASYRNVKATARTCLIVCSPDGRPPAFTVGDPRLDQSCHVPNNYVMQRSKAIPGHNIEQLPAMSLAACLGICNERDNCLSVDYRRSDGYCFLQDVTSETVELVVDASYDHFQRKKSR